MDDEWRKMEKGVGLLEWLQNYIRVFMIISFFFFILEVLKGRTIHSLVLTFILRTRLELDPELSH